MSSAADPGRDPGRDPATTIHDVLRSGGVRSVFQAIVDLGTGEVAAYEALARGPVGPLQAPGALFTAARGAGLLAELDRACRSAAFRGASDLGLLAPLTVFVNVEPEVLDGAPLSELLAIADAAPGDLRVVVEITERALAARPAELLQTVERVRDLGWGIALDDVGAEPASLAFMSLLSPDVVKLDMSLVQGRPSPRVAEVMAAVHAYAERTGALVLAEGIETEQHLATARALGATLAQGWYFGRAEEHPAPPASVRPLRLPSAVACGGASAPTSPFDCLPAGTVLRTAPKRLLVEVSKQLEREGRRLGETCVVASTFQYSQHFTPATALRYRDLVDRVGFVCAIGEGLPLEPVPGLRGGSLDQGDPLLGEWDVVVLSPHVATALLARDLGDVGPEMDRTFEYALTHDRETVAAAGRQLLLRVARRTGPEPTPVTTRVTTPAPVASVTVAVSESVTEPLTGEGLLRRALAASTSGVVITDMTLPDQPMVFTNAAFDRLAGFDGTALLGRNCRMLQGVDTDAAALARVRAALLAGQECHELLLNYRGPERTPWWNELHLSPVRDATGRVVQYIGVQNDVSTRVWAERELVQEQDRGRSLEARIDLLSATDPLTGLLNRRQFEDRLEAALLQARMNDRAVALLLLDLDGFRSVNDAHGHVAGDALLRVVAHRLQGRLRSSDLLARLGGDEFLVALPGLEPATAGREARRVAEQLEAAVRPPVRLPGTAADVSVSTTTGISLGPSDAEEPGRLLHLAFVHLHERKRSLRAGGVRPTR